MIDRRKFIEALATLSTMSKAQLWTSASVKKDATPCRTTLHPMQKADEFDLESSALRVRLSPTGFLERIENLESQEAYSFSSDTFSITTNKGTFSNVAVRPNMKVSESGIVSYTFVNNGQYSISVNYRLGRSGHYIERWLAIENLVVPIDVLQISFSWTCHDTPPREVIKYDTLGYVHCHCYVYLYLIQIRLPFQTL
jgi:hypothetical protein